LGVAVEAFLLEEQAVEGGDGLLGAAVARPAAQRGGHLVQAGQIPARLEVGIFLARDQQRGLGQIDIGIGSGHHLAETQAGSRLRHARAPSGVRDYTVPVDVSQPSPFGSVRVMPGTSMGCGTAVGNHSNHRPVTYTKCRDSFSSAFSVAASKVRARLCASSSERNLARLPLPPPPTS